MTSLSEQTTAVFADRVHVDPPVPSAPSTEPAVYASFSDWMLFGIEQGWVGPDICLACDGEPMSAQEYDSGEETGQTDCFHVVRLYESFAVKAEIEAFHSPSVWRKPQEHRNHPDTQARVAEAELAREAAVLALEAE
jgi:hypothetical protein